MIEIVRQTTRSDVLHNLLPYAVVAFLLLAVAIAILHIKVGRPSQEARVRISVVSGLLSFLVLGFGFTSQPPYQVVKDGYHTTTKAVGGEQVLVVQNNHDEQELLFRVKDGSSEQVRKILPVMDVDNDALLVTWHDAGPHSLSVNPKTVRYIKPSEESKVKDALSKIQKAVTKEADALFSGHAGSREREVQNALSKLENALSDGVSDLFSGAKPFNLSNDRKTKDALSKLQNAFAGGVTALFFATASVATH